MVCGGSAGCAEAPTELPAQDWGNSRHHVDWTFRWFSFTNTNSSENHFEEEEGQSTWTRLSVAHMFSWSRLCRGREAGNLECPAPRPATSSRNMEKCGECWLRCRLSSSFDIITSKNMYLSAKMRSLKSMRQYPVRCMQI